MVKRITICIMMLVFVMFSASAFGKDIVVYQKLDHGNTRYDEYIETIQTALEKTKKTYGDFELKQSEVVTSELRAIVDTKNGINQNITWCGSNGKYEEELIPIYIPLGKGILGYRVFLITKDNAENFSKIKTLQDLREYKVGHGFDWGDLPIYEYNKLPFETGHYEGLFAMLNAGRFDYFSRGIKEAYKEFDERKKKYPNMRIEENVLLYYPWPFILYVSPKFPKIAQRVETGMRIMIKDGTFDKIFFKYNADAIRKAKLKSRTLIKMENPFLTPKFKAIDKSLYYDPIN